MQDVTLIGIDLGNHSFRLHEQDRHETKFFREHASICCGAVILAREEHVSPADIYDRGLVGNRRRVPRVANISYPRSVSK